jgi:uncharacterized protein (DUF3820 family)
MSHAVLKTMSHGKAVMPWGRWKGTRIRLLPDEYLSWLTSSDIVLSRRWNWLRESLFAELKFRGMREDLAKSTEPEYDSTADGCQAVVLPYWNTLLECTSEICHRPLPCAIHDAAPKEETNRRIRLEEPCDKT